MLGPDESSYRTLTATEGEGWVILSPGVFGSVTLLEISDEEICVAEGAFLRSIGEIESTSKTQGLNKAMF